MINIQCMYQIWSLYVQYTHYEEIKGSSKCKNWVVWGHSKSSAMSPFDTVHMTAYSTLLGTMHLSCAFFEIWQTICQNFLPYLHLAPPYGVPPVRFQGDLWQQKTRFPGLSCGIVCVILHLAINALETAQKAVLLWPTGNLRIMGGGIPRSQQTYVLKQLDNWYVKLKNDDKRT